MVQKFHSERFLVRNEFIIATEFSFIGGDFHGSSQRQKQGVINIWKPIRFSSVWIVQVQVVLSF